MPSKGNYCENLYRLLFFICFLFKADRARSTNDELNVGTDYTWASVYRIHFHKIFVLDVKCVCDSKFKFSLNAKSYLNIDTELHLIRKWV